MRIVLKTEHEETAKIIISFVSRSKLPHSEAGRRVIKEDSL